MAWGSHSEKEMIIGKVIFEISRKNDVHNNYETDYKYNVLSLNRVFYFVPKSLRLLSVDCQTFLGKNKKILN